MPKGIRPTQNKVRKAVFDILGDIEGVSFLELFAGSGAVGFEAFSRGAGSLTLVEQDRDCIQVIRKNIEALGLGNCSLIPLETESAIRLLHKDKRSFETIFLDPPYYSDLVPRLRSGSRETQNDASLSKKTLQMLGAYDILAPIGLVVVQHSKKDELPREAGKLILVKQAKYGDTVISIYKKEA